MKNIEAFEKWKTKEWPFTFMDDAITSAWKSCESLYESRKCDDCKRFVTMKPAQVDINGRESINEIRTCPYVGFYNVPNDFSCKHWKSKFA